jgi:hypothetical protein
VAAGVEKTVATFTEALERSPLTWAMVSLALGEASSGGSGRFG